ncbi:Transcription factor MYB1 [Hondaea fermentalgiana]|uniref:Transcription factor MYB1 n=1 Tax=Hondaea fermentalgiana TaxID=2315210 RepID=A0A2R5GKW0_9STRA|nr:Transcription factor MYB1 [Hondaea fermentalgiana]|eukprot:GBG31542.1 Transcription factor MYB1 [Hondaea fermentalgiana]
MTSEDEWVDRRDRQNSLSLSQLSEVASQTPPLVTSSSSVRLKNDGLSPFLTTAAAFAASSPYYDSGTPASPLSAIRHGFPRSSSNLRRNLADSNALRYGMDDQPETRESSHGEGEDDEEFTRSVENGGHEQSRSGGRRSSGRQRRGTGEDADDGDADGETPGGSRQWKKAKIQRGSASSGNNRSSSNRVKGARSSRKSAGTRGGSYDRASNGNGGANGAAPAGSRSAPPKTKALKAVVTGLTETGKIRSQHRGAWTAEEDEELIKLVKRSGACGWTQIALDLGTGRNGRQCRERWSNQINPDLVRAKWCDDEDEVILRAHAEIGNRWATIAKLLPGRTDNMVKNRFNGSLLPKQLRKARERGEDVDSITKGKTASGARDKRKATEFSAETLALAERLKLKAPTRDAPASKPSTRGKVVNRNRRPGSPDTEPTADLHSSDRNSDDEEGSTGPGAPARGGTGASRSGRKASLASSGAQPETSTTASTTSSQSTGSATSSSARSAGKGTSRPLSATTTTQVPLSGNKSGRAAPKSARSAPKPSRPTTSGKRGVKRRAGKQRSESNSSDEVNDVMAKAERTTNVTQQLIEQAKRLGDTRNLGGTTLGSPERFMDWFPKGSPASLMLATPQPAYAYDANGDIDVGASSRELFKSERPAGSVLDSNFDLSGAGADGYTASPIRHLFGMSPLPRNLDSPADLRRGDGLSGKQRVFEGISSGFSDILNGDSIKKRRLNLLQQSPAADDPLSRITLNTPRGGMHRFMASTPMTVSSDFGADSILGGSVVKHNEVIMQQLAALSTGKRNLDGTEMQGLRDPSNVRRSLEDDVSPSASPVPSGLNGRAGALAKLRESALTRPEQQQQQSSSSSASTVTSGENCNGQVNKAEGHRFLKTTKAGPGLDVAASFVATPADSDDAKKKKLGGLDPDSEAARVAGNALGPEEDFVDNGKRQGGSSTSSTGGGPATDDAEAPELCSRSSSSSPDPTAMQQSVVRTGKDIWDISDTPCKCRRSKCLKLYCTCFASEMHCGSNCQCMECCNQKDNVMWLKAAQLAVEKKLSSDPPRQCRCRNSQCLKKYCDCFRAGVKCGPMCKCCDCQNTTAPATNQAHGVRDRVDTSSLESACTEDSNSREALEIFRQDQEMQQRQQEQDHHHQQQQEKGAPQKMDGGDRVAEDRSVAAM